MLLKRLIIRFQLELFMYFNECVDFFNTHIYLKEVTFHNFIICTFCFSQPANLIFVYINTAVCKNAILTMLLLLALNYICLSKMYLVSVCMTSHYENSSFTEAAVDFLYAS